MAPKPPADDVAVAEPPVVESALDQYRRLAADITPPEPAAPAAGPGEEPLPLVVARYAGVDPVLAVIDGAQVIVKPGDPIPVTVEQFEQNPVFEAWKD